MDPFAAESAPRVNPLGYPGVWPDTSVVITPDELRPVRDLASVDISGRVPVLAIGSNAAPSQLRHKFAATGESFEIVSMRARVHDVVVGFCSFAVRFGYIPATLIPAPGLASDMALQFVTEAELEGLDATEKPAYQRVWIDTEIHLDTGDVLGGAYAYVAAGGYLADDRGPWLMGASIGGLTAFADQRALLRRLLADPSIAAVFGADPESFVARGISLGRSAAVLLGAGVVHEENALYGEASGGSLVDPIH